MAASDEQTAWQRVADALRSGGIDGVGSRAGAESFETHISLVVVYESIVYKLKKPVTFEYLDYGTRALRKRMCQEEIRVNQPLGGDLYLGIRGVREGAAGPELCEEDDPDAVEHLVEMRRLAVEEMLSYRVKTAQVLPQAMQAIGQRIGAYHREARVLDPPAGQPATVAALIERLLATARDGTTVLDPSGVQALDMFFSRWLEVNSDRLRERAAAGWIRDGHGDLRLEHVVVSDPVRIIDAVEFDESLRANDVLADLAFMVMELQLEEREDLTSALVRAWVKETDSLDERLLWAYAAMRALARIEVALSRLEQLAPGDFTRSPVVESAQSLLKLAVKLTWRAREPRAVIFAGLAGSGKTSISTKLATRWGLERLSSDELRKRQVDVGRKDAAPPYAYEPWVSKDVYEQLGREAGRELAAGRSVVVDATFRDPRDAQAFVRKFKGSGALTAPIVIACTASEETLRKRVTDRSELGGSDADLEVLDDQLRTYGERPIGISDPIALATDGPIAATLQRAEELAISATVN